MQKTETVNRLLDTTPQLWRGRRPNHRQRTIPTQHPSLDARLPGGGWPLGAVSELITRQPGLGEFSLLLPALAAVAERGQWVILVDPPWIPYPAALCARERLLERLLLIRTRRAEESLWACEQALRSGRGGAVLAWPERIAFARLRRLQLAAVEHGKLAFLFRPESARDEASPAALRLQLDDGGPRGTRVAVLKCRGSHPPGPAWVPRPFSTYGNHRLHTGNHENRTPESPRPLLAGAAPSTPGPRSAYAGPGRAGDTRGHQPGQRAPRTDH